MVDVHGDHVVFRFFRPEAREGSLAGEFNGWRTDQLRMQKDAGGWWVGRLSLPAGTYRFRYWVDGAWFADFAAFGVRYGPFGPDSVVVVGDGQTAASQVSAG